MPRSLALDGTREGGLKPALELETILTKTTIAPTNKAERFNMGQKLVLFALEVLGAFLGPPALKFYLCIPCCVPSVLTSHMMRSLIL